jgi:hypothetical protein
LDRSVPTVFISYRRRDTALITELLANHLRGRFPVFFDLEAIELGAAFMSRIQRELSDADIVLVVIGAGWDPARLQEQADVVAYELRLARRFGRRIIPVVVAPAIVPAPASLPHDLRWLSELNAFVVPEPPGHSAAMVQLAHLLEKPTTPKLSSHTAFATPQDAGMLRRQEGNIPFREADALDDAHLCRIASNAGGIWLASFSAVELRALADGTTLCSAKARAVEWLHPTESGAIVATSGNGYHAPDTIRFERFVCRDGRLDKSACGVGWSWQTPPLALSPDESLLAGYLEDPRSGRAQIGFVKLDADDEVEYLDNTLDVSSLTFDLSGERLYALGRQSGRWQVSSINVASRSVDWSHELEADLSEPAPGPDLRYWPGRESLLLVVASHVYELDSASGKSRRRVLTLQGAAPVVATDPATSLGCAVDEASVIVFSALSTTAVSLAHGATRGLACDVRDGAIVVLVEDGDRRRLLIAEDVPEAFGDPPAEAPA